MKLKIKAVIMAGGLGKRLWPLSRKKWPKFMLKLQRDRSLLQMAYERLGEMVSGEDRYIVTGKDIGFLVENEIKKIDGNFRSKNLFLEPCVRNTAPAIMMGIKNFVDEDIVVVLPADHIIEPENVFRESIRKAIAIACRDYIVAIGIQPAYPATGYGYIKRSDKSIEEGYEAEEFKEKPGEDKAEEYLKSGNYFWNAGIFVFKAGVMKEEIKKYEADIFYNFDNIKPDHSNIEEVYKNMPGISIDYAVMERTGRAAVVGYGGGWNDLGSWEAVKEVISGEQGIFVKGEKEVIDCKNTFIYTEPEKLVACVGLENVIAVDTEDALLIMKMGEGQKVKEIVENLKDAPVTKYHPTDYRPWGNYKILAGGEGYRIKILEIDPGQRLSLQKHKYRDEMWTVIEGKGVITVDEKKVGLNKEETIRIPAGAAHRAENSGDTTLKILELATGEKISEEDIIRLQDDYDR